MENLALRDIFLSHRSTAKAFVRQLAADIEGEAHQGRSLLAWVDEAEIRHGQSIPGLINSGLENSRFFGIVMTPDYFASESGWTDAEWHAALHSDPDNGKGRIIPILGADCPYVPALLRHLNTIDFRDTKYAQGLRDLLRVLRDEPLPRPTIYRGQLITPDGRVDRSTITAARAAPDAIPDAVVEMLGCNLLPFERWPQNVYVAPIAAVLRSSKADGTGKLPSKQQLKDAIRAAQVEAKVERSFMPAFRTFEDTIVTFHDLNDPEGPLAPIVDIDHVEDPIPITQLLRFEDDRRMIVSLSNMAISRHARRISLIEDETKTRRFFFPPRNGGPNVITWTPFKNRATRTVAKPCMKDNQVVFWRHQAAYLDVLFLANRFFLKITPTWVLTEDGCRVKGGPKVGQVIINWTGPERNAQVLYHVRFWTSVLRNRRPGPISIWAGDQTIEISTTSALVQQPCGIASDQKDLLQFLDQEAPIIAGAEDSFDDVSILDVLSEDFETEVDDAFAEEHLLGLEDE